MGVEYRGRWGRVVWGTNASGRCPALKAFERYSGGAQAEAIALFQRLAEHGKIADVEKFRPLAGTNPKMFEFKARRAKLRCVGGFHPTVQGVFVLVHVFPKERGKASPNDLKLAQQRFNECVEERGD